MPTFFCKTSVVFTSGGVLSCVSASRSPTVSRVTNEGRVKTRMPFPDCSFFFRKGKVFGISILFGERDWLFVPSPSEYSAVCSTTLSFISGLSVQYRAQPGNDEAEGGVPRPRPQRGSYNRCFNESKSSMVGIQFASICLQACLKRARA